MAGPNFHHFHFVVLTGSVSLGYSQFIYGLLLSDGRTYFSSFSFCTNWFCFSWVVSSFMGCCYLMAGPNFHDFHFVVLTGSVSLG